jgi:hypothetical protein
MLPVLYLDLSQGCVLVESELNWFGSELGQMSGCSERGDETLGSI